MTPAAPRSRRRRRVRVPAQRDVDRRDGPGAPPGRQRRARRRRRHVGARAACASTPSAFDVYYFAPQKCFASDGGLWLALLLAARDRAHRARCTRATAGCRRRSTSRSRSRTRASTRPTTRPRSRRSSCSTTSSSGCSPTAGMEFAAGRCDTVGRHRLRLGRAARARDAVRRRRRRPQPRDRDDRLRRHGRRGRGRRGAARQRHRSTSSRTESSAATSCASRCSRRSSPTTSSASPARSTTSSTARQRVGSVGRHRLGRSMLLLHEVHTVAGRHEDEFEAAFRDGWMPTLAKRRRRAPPLLPAARARHRPGVPHASRSRRCATAPRTSGSRRACSAATCAAGPPTSTGCATRWRASSCCRSTGHRCRTSTSRPCPTDGREHDAVLYMEDSAWPHEAMLDTYLEKARTHYAPSLEAAHRAFAAHAARRVPGRARRAAPARGRAVAARRLPRAAARRCSPASCPRT